MNRGILVTEYASLKKDVTYEDVKSVYDRFATSLAFFTSPRFTSHSP